MGIPQSGDGNRFLWCSASLNLDRRRRAGPRERDWNVVALTESDDGVGTDGRIVERYAYTSYGEFIVLQGDSGNGELGNVLPISSVGNLFAHQGLGFD